MLETPAVKKNKISLPDYDFEKDIKNRILMSSFTTTDAEVLEEILYSSLKISLKKLAKNLDQPLSNIEPSLEKLGSTGLFSRHGDELDIDKEMRKYWESQFVTFEDDFKPNLEFLSQLLKKVPIQILPSWYSIPRTSNNIFDSLVEKFLLTPALYRRYLLEVKLANPHLAPLIDDLFASPELKLRSKDVMKRYELTHEQFEEEMLYLEFSFICCVRHEKADGKWEEVITPFHEWHEYLSFLKETNVTTLDYIPNNESEFTFVEELSDLLQNAQKKPIPLSEIEDQQMVKKACLLKVAAVQNDLFHPEISASEWLQMDLTNRALYIYRNPLNQILSPGIPEELKTERNIREAEKSIIRVLDSGWVAFEDFIKGVHTPVGEQSAIALEKIGRHWHYALPKYSNEETALIKAVIFEWLYEVGLVKIGNHEGRECFCITSLGQSLFEQ